MPKATPVMVAILVLFSWTTSIAQNQPAHEASRFEISECHVTVRADVPGATYTVTQDLEFYPWDCIDVTASGVTINLNGHTLGTSPCNCAGVSIAKGARGVHILDGKIVGRTPTYGVHDMGDFALIENVTVVGAGTSGIFLDGVKGSVVKGANVSGTFDGAAISLTDTDHCVVENSIANQNGVPPCVGGMPCGGSHAAGIFVGNSGSKGLSKNNFITGNQANDNVPFGIEVGGSGNMVVSNTTVGNNFGGDGDGFGIYVVPIGVAGPVENNLIMNNSSSDNEVDDGYDSNPQCGTDRWVLNDLITSNQPCVR